MIDPSRVLLGGLLLTAAWAFLGAQFLVPWRLVRGFEACRRPWSLTAAPLGVVGLAALAIWASLRSEALATSEILPWGQTPEARALTVLVPALLGANLVVLFGWSKISGRAWMIPSVLGLSTLVAIAVLIERLRGDVDGTWASAAVAAGIWMAMAIATGQILSPSNAPRLTAFALFALAPLSYWLLAPELRAAILDHGALAPLACGTLLGVSAAAFRKRGIARGCAAAATLLLAIFFTWSAMLGDQLAGQLPTMPPLPS